MNSINCQSMIHKNISIVAYIANKILNELVNISF